MRNLVFKLKSVAGNALFEKSTVIEGFTRPKLPYIDAVSVSRDAPIRDRINAFYTLRDTVMDYMFRMERSGHLTLDEARRLARANGVTGGEIVVTLVTKSFLGESKKSESVVTHVLDRQ